MVGEFAEDLVFKVVQGEVEASAGVAPEVGLGDDFLPDFSAAEGEVEGGSGLLADGPDHAEIAGGGSAGGGASFDDDDFESSFGGGEGVG